MSATMDAPRLAPRLAPDAERWLDALPVAVLGVDLSLRIRYVNTAAAALLSGPARGVLGRTLEELFGHDGPLPGLVDAAARRLQTVTATDVPLQGPGVNLGWADVHAAPVDDGRFVALTVAPKGRAQATVEPRPVSAAARTLAHEVRNPLAGIRAAAQLIGREAADDVRELTDLICAETDRIRRLTDRIDALDGLAPPKLAAVNVHEALQRVRSVVAPAFPDVVVAERYDPSLPDVQGDLDQLIQAFLNLAKNAAEATQGRPGATVTMATAYRPGIRVRAAGAGAARPQLEVAIEDNGPGLPPHMRQRVFEPFVTSKPGGMGLGLAVASEVLARHGGRIEVDSVPGRTVFRALLPIDRGDMGT